MEKNKLTKKSSQKYLSSNGKDETAKKHDN